MRIALFVFSFFILINANAHQLNSYYQQLDSAVHLTKAGNLKLALATYEGAFETTDYVNVTFLRRALNLSKELEDTERMKHYSDRIQNQLQGKLPELFPIIDSLYEEDQRIRSKKYWRTSRYYYNCNNKGTCKTESKRYSKSKASYNEWLNTDQSNIQALLKLIEKHGYLGEEIIGRKQQQAMLILLHFDSDTNNRILQPILDKALNEGKILPKHYAWIIDRHLFFVNGTQKYWIWPCSNKGSKLKLNEAEKAEIIKKRTSIGIFSSDFYQEKKGNYWILRNIYNKP